MLEQLIPFLAILNPFALCLYLVGVMEDVTPRQFARVMLGACVISLVAFWVCAATGEQLLVNVLGVRPAAMRIFGGIIFLVVAYNYVLKGYRATEMLRGSLSELPSAIALPYMIGAGTITQAILVGKAHDLVGSAIVLAIGVFIVFVVAMLFNLARIRLARSRERVFERYVNILSRLNGLLIGAISTEMIVGGLHDLWLLTGGAVTATQPV